MNSRKPERTTIHTAALAALLLLSACGVKTGSGALEDARRDIAAGDYGAALVVLQNVLDKSPDDAAALLLLARTQLQRGDFDAAEKALAKAESAGAAAGELAELRARLMLDQGSAQALLSRLDSGIPGLTPQRREYFRARALLAVGQVPEALVLFKSLVGKGADDAELQTRIAQCHAVYGRIDAARQALAQATAQKPGPAEGWLLLASIEERAGNRTAADAALDHAFATAPGQLAVPGHVALLSSGIRSAMARGDEATASRYFESLTQIAPQAVVTSLLSAEVKLAQGDAAAAVSTIQRLIQEHPEQVRARAVLVSGLLATGSTELALKEFADLSSRGQEPPESKMISTQIRKAASSPSESVERAIATASVQVALDTSYAARRTLAAARERNPDSMPLAIGAAQVELRSGSLSAAETQIQSLLQKQPDNRDLLLARADIRMMMGDSAGARAIYESLWSSEQGEVLALSLARARKLSGSKDPQESLRTWLAAHPDATVVRLALAEALSEAGETAPAIREYEQALARRPSDPILMNNLANLYQRAGDSRALGLARKAHELAGTVPQVMDTYGWLLVQAGDATKGVALLQEAARNLPSAAVIRYHLAAAWARTGNRAPARRLLADLLQDTTPFTWRREAEQLLVTLHGAEPEPSA